MEYKLNYSFQESDNRDYIYNHLSSLNKSSYSNTPSSFIINKKITILDQGQLGSCVSNAFAHCILIATGNNVLPSRLFHYYCGRLLSGLSNINDTGLNIRNACKIIAKVGICQEISWPYYINNFAIMPPLSAFQYPQCRFFKSYSYVFITQTSQMSLIDNIKNFVKQNNCGVIFGISVYISFLSQNVANTGIVPTPDPNNETYQGGHCMVIIGYDDSKKQFTVINSWGVNWGNKGICYLSYDYINNPSLANDFVGLNFVY